MSEKSEGPWCVTLTCNRHEMIGEEPSVPDIRLGGITRFWNDVATKHVKDNGCVVEVTWWNKVTNVESITEFASPSQDLVITNDASRSAQELRKQLKAQEELFVRALEDRNMLDALIKAVGKYLPSGTVNSLEGIERAVKELHEKAHPKREVHMPPWFGDALMWARSEDAKRAIERSPINAEEARAKFAADRIGYPATVFDKILDEIGLWRDLVKKLWEEHDYHAEERAKAATP